MSWPLLALQIARLTYFLMLPVLQRNGHRLFQNYFSTTFFSGHLFIQCLHFSWGNISMARSYDLLIPPGWGWNPPQVHCPSSCVPSSTILHYTRFSPKLSKTRLHCETNRVLQTISHPTIPVTQYSPCGSSSSKCTNISLPLWEHSLWPHHSACSSFNGSCWLAN